MSEEQTVTYELEGEIALVGLNRPDKRNAFDSTMLRELAAAYGELDADDTLRAGVLYGEGTMFTAGLDLASVAGDIQSGVSHVPEGGINPWQVDGKTYAVPFTFGIEGFWYNTDLFEQAGIDAPPTTLDELKDAVAKLKDAGITPIAVGANFQLDHVKRWAGGDHGVVERGGVAFLFAARVLHLYCEHQPR